MNRRKANRRKRIIIAYTLRTIVGIVIVGALFLMGCGCQYLYEKITEKSTFEKYQTQGNAGVLQDVMHLEPEKVGTIVLDAGHGGVDCGTSYGEVLEKDINLEVVMQMKELLEDKNIEVILTRSADSALSLEERAQIANQEKADLFVSIHCNYFEDDSDVKGLECYYYKESEKGQSIAESIIGSLQQQGNITVRTAKEDSFYVLRETKIPAVLVELGYLSNVEECGMLNSHGYQETLAMELTEALESIISGALP